MSYTPFASGSASSSRTPLRNRHDPSDADAISAGAYLARPIAARRSTDAAHGSKGKGKERESLIPGYRIGSRGWVREAFRLFGEHCARNQIRTLLIDCLVMTNLFYPALSTYLQRRFPPLHPPSTPSHETHRDSYLGSPMAHSACRHRRKKEHPLSLLSTPVLDSFFPYPPPLLPRLDWGGWWTDTGQDEWTGPRVRTTGDEEEVRLVRIGWADVGEVLDREDEREDYAWTERDYGILDLVRHAVESWSEQNGHNGETCIRQLREVTDNVQPAGDCYLFSHAEVAGLTSTSSLFSHNCSHHAELTYDNDDGRVYRSVAALFRLPSASSRDSFAERWAGALEGIAKRVDAEVFVEADRPHRNPTDTIDAYHLSYHPPKSHDPADKDSASPNDGATPKSVLFLYLVLFSILGHQLSGATKVHSRFGLAFTGIVQLCCSAVMSFSVLALLGWNGWGWGAGNETTLPTYVLPFVIVVVGAENMSTLTKAVFSVPFNHSVPVRIGLGLSKVGTTIALTSLTDLVLLLGIWLCVNLRPVREFCLFAAVVIITDWFMLHTFFLTVLSIDAQRLELADVLASNGGVTEVPRPKEDETDQGAPPVERGWRKMVRARTSKSGSLLFILICVGVIYYLTERHRLPLSTPGLYGYKPTPTGHSTSSAQAFVTKVADLEGLSIAEKLWRSINPGGLPHVTAIVPPASILVLPRLGHHMRPADLRKLSLPTSRIILPRLKPLFYVFKVVVLPQAATAGTLYAVLLFLLKDADLLDAQRNRLGRNEEPRDTDDEDGNGGKGRGVKNVRVHILPCSHEADIDVVASSDDGKVIVSVGIDNTLCLWRFSEIIGTGTRESMRSEALTNAEAVVDVAVSGNGKAVAALLAGGTLLQWQIEDGALPVALPTIELPQAWESVRYVETRKPDDPFLSRPSSPHHQGGDHELLVTGSDGSVYSVTSTGQTETIIQPSPNARLWVLESCTGTTSEIAVLLSAASEVTLYRRSDAGWYRVNISAATSSRVSTATLTTSNVALGYRSGLIEIFDLDGSPVVTISGSSSSTVPTSTGIFTDGIKHLAIATPAHSACTTCGLVSTDSMFVISSAAERVIVDRVNPRGSIPCRCRRGSVLDDNKYPSSVSGANDSPSRLVIPPTGFRGGFSPGASPKRSPSLLPPVPGDIPLSYHGSRRLSSLHREEASPGLGMTGLSVTPTSPDSDLEVLPLGAILTPGGVGAWTVSGDLLVGLRRVGGGIDDAQWETWLIDLRAPWNGSSLVVDAAPLTALLHRATAAPNTTVRAQRAERLLSLNGRAPFPSLGASFSVDTFPPLAYTEIRPFHAVPKSNGGKGGVSVPRMGKVFIGLGNRMGVISIPLAREKKRATSGQAGPAGVGLGIASLGVTGFGVTPPPPSARRSVGEESKKLL